MKFVDEKGRIFGLVNFVDLLAVLAALLVAGAICWKLFANKVTEAVSPSVTMTTQIRIKGASRAMYDALNGACNPVGKQLVAGTDYVPDTLVESMTFEPYSASVTTADGQIVTAFDDTRYDVIIVLKSKSSKDTPVPKIATQEIRVGRTMTFKTNDFETYANIEMVSFE